MSHSKIIVFVLIASLLTQGCISTVYLKPTDGSPDAPATAREVDGEILKNEGGILYVDDGDKVVEIPTEVIEDIDHAGASVAVAGGVMSLLGVGFFFLALAIENPDEMFGGIAFFPALAGIGLFVVGIPISIGGIIAYGQSTAASRGEDTDDNYLEELSVAPSPFTVPSARGLGVTISF